LRTTKNWHSFEENQAHSWYHSIDRWPTFFHVKSKDGLTLLFKRKSMSKKSVTFFMEVDRSLGVEMHF
jgi:hypothetical protein